MSNKKVSSFYDKTKGILKLYFGKGDIYNDPELYDELVLRYKKRAEMAIDIANLVEEYLPISQNNPAVILELAAGTGIITKELVARSYHIVATDISEKFLAKISSEIHDKKVSIQLADMNKHLSFPNNYFDGLTTACSNRYISSEGFTVFLQEVFRVLKDGGIFVWPITVADFFIWKKNSGIFQPSRVGTIRDHLRRYGFEIVDVRSENRNIMRRSKMLPSTTKYIISRKPI